MYYIDILVRCLWHLAHTVSKYDEIIQRTAFLFTDIFLFPSSHTQVKIQGKIGYMFRLE